MKPILQCPYCDYAWKVRYDGRIPKNCPGCTIRFRHAALDVIVLLGTPVPEEAEQLQDEW